jgi:hypothetical protein
VAADAGISMAAAMIAPAAMVPSRPVVVPGLVMIRVFTVLS